MLPRAEGALTRKHLALIKVAQRQLDLDEEAYRSILLQIAGVGSARDLDRAGFDALMREFSRLGFESYFHAANLGSRPLMATPAQVATIRALWSEYTAGEGTDATLGKWLDNKFGVSALRFLPKDRVSKVLAALRAMVARKR